MRTTFLAQLFCFLLANEDSVRCAFVGLGECLSAYHGKNLAAIPAGRLPKSLRWTALKIFLHALIVGFILFAEHIIVTTSTLSGSFQSFFFWSLVRRSSCVFILIGNLAKYLDSWTNSVNSSQSVVFGSSIRRYPIVVDVGACTSIILAAIWPVTTWCSKSAVRMSSIGRSWPIQIFIQEELPMLTLQRLTYRRSSAFVSIFISLFFPNFRGRTWSLL